MYDWATDNKFDLFIYTTIQKFVVRFCFKEINTFIQQEHITVIKSDSKNF